MKTKNIFNIASVVAMMSLVLTSCNDWLTVHPQTQIVEENFWEDKNDLEGVRYAVYKNMASQVDKMIVWGDLRSDIYKQPIQRTSGQGNRDKYRDILAANIDTTWTEYDWSGMYSTIGYCNKVLQHGEEILEKDKQFTASEWRQMKAEMVTMRAMSYFYLVRAFKSIPYTTKVVNSDSEIEYFQQIPALDVMDSLITDVESVAGQARNRFIDKKETKGQITNTAIYALLSDMYLWRASLREGRSKTDEEITEAMVIDDYQKAIYNSELSVYKLKEQFDEERKGLGSFLADDYLSWTGAPEFNGKQVDFMYKNDVDEADRKNVNMYAYRQIFGNGNSYESIFELQFSSSDSRKNGIVNSMWGASDNTHLAMTTKSENFKDLRFWFSSWRNISKIETPTDFFCLKWLKVTPTIETVTSGSEVVEIDYDKTDDYNNWIVYRLSDVLLINAEARACLANLNVNKKDNEDVCKKLMRMVNRRWWVDLTAGGDVNTNLDKSETYDIGSTDWNDYPKSSKSSMNLLCQVLDTKKREFFGEGKRWFDLVRFAERLSSNDDDDAGMIEMYEVFFKPVKDDYNTTKARCTNLWGLYSPIYYMECKAYRAGGSNINQNPIWNKSKYDRQ